MSTCTFGAAACRNDVSALDVDGDVSKHDARASGCGIAVIRKGVVALDMLLLRSETTSLPPTLVLLSSGLACPPLIAALHHSERAVLHSIFVGLISETR